MIETPVAIAIVVLIIVVAILVAIAVCGPLAPKPPRETAFGRRRSDPAMWLHACPRVNRTLTIRASSSCGWCGAEDNR